MAEFDKPLQDAKVQQALQTVSEAVKTSEQAAGLGGTLQSGGQQGPPSALGAVQTVSEAVKLPQQVAILGAPVQARIQQGLPSAAQALETAEQAVGLLGAQGNTVQKTLQTTSQALQTVSQASNVLKKREPPSGRDAPPRPPPQEAEALRPIDHAMFSFTSKADPSAGWRVAEFEAREALSEVYECRIDLVNVDMGVKPDALLGGSCELVITRGGFSRKVLGIVRRVERLGTRGRYLLARVYVVPALWALSQRRDSRIFQQKSVKDILSEVLVDALGEYNRKVNVELHGREYPKREYCVQYRETDLDFALRLMEEEGISFFFEHTGEEEELVLFDASIQLKPCPMRHVAPLEIRGPEMHLAQTESLRQLEFTHQMQSTAVVVRDFDWTRFNWTQPVFLSEERRQKEPGGPEREVYEYPAPLTIGGYDQKEGRYSEADGKSQSTLRYEALEARRRQGQGHGNVTGFQPGKTFNVNGHLSAELDQRYLLVRVEHRGWAPEELPLAPEAEKNTVDGQRYINRFECMPHSVLFRPERRTAPPRISGLQTAIVVGPQGQDDIYTDAHGRIKVSFHWDRESKYNEKSSCFVRVAQSLAGAKWGTFFLPRIGMEVLVDFLEGNPDRPLVVGCVYNDQKHTPYPLPENKSRSTIRTVSTPGSDESNGQRGFNELRFEDALGREEIFLHAQKDFNEQVLNCHNTTVDAHQTNTVKGSQTEKVSGDQSMTVVGKRTKTVQKDEETHIKANRTETVTGNETITIQGSRTEDVTGNESVTVTGNRLVQVNGGSSTDTLLVKKDIYIESETTNVHVKAAKTVVLECGKSSVTLKEDGTIVLDGAKEITLQSGSSSVKVAPAGVTVSGPKVSSAAVGIHEINGALIKIG
jgi:type VI secretion system secreted protein VgrG